MKKLAIFCDGTWNHLGMPERTNVSRLAKCVAARSVDGAASQIVFYDDGVGVGTGLGAVDWGVKLLGGALGRGLNAKIESAYRFIVLNYEPGDDLYIFGFSRGAYTARSLCGFIRKCGILRRDCVDMTPRAMEVYRSDLHPHRPEVVEFRARYTHALAAGREDYERLGIVEEMEGRGEARTLADLYQYRPERTYRMMYLGVWDTVGSLGLPDRVPRLSRLFNGKYKFLDTVASSLMSSIRHAVAIDEARRVFGATTFDNLDELNRLWAGATGWDVAHPGAGHHVPYSWRPYQELWSPGDHGAVGGGNPERGLSSLALLWIAEGAERAGLHLTGRPGNELGEAVRLANPCADWTVTAKGQRPARRRDMLGDIGGYRPRRGPLTADEIAPATYDRWCRMAAYRPANLNLLAGAACPPPPPAPAPPGFPTL